MDDAGTNRLDQTATAPRFWRVSSVGLWTRSISFLVGLSLTAIAAEFQRVTRPLPFQLP